MINKQRILDNKSHKKRRHYKHTHRNDTAEHESQKSYIEEIVDL